MCTVYSGLQLDGSVQQVLREYYVVKAGDADDRRRAVGAFDASDGGRSTLVREELSSRRPEVSRSATLATTGCEGPCW